MHPQPVLVLLEEDLLGALDFIVAHVCVLDASPSVVDSHEAYEEECHVQEYVIPQPPADREACKPPNRKL